MAILNEANRTAFGAHSLWRIPPLAHAACASTKSFARRTFQPRREKINRVERSAK
jgi:hypothetical protein